MSVLEIPEPSLVVLIGISGSGKSTFAAEHFGAYEVISSDHCRGLVSDDPNSKEATVDAFEVLEFIATKRMRAGKLTVIDATSVQPAARKKLIDLARSQDVLPVAIVLNLPEQVCAERNAARGTEGSIAASCDVNTSSSRGRCAGWLVRASARSTSSMGSRTWRRRGSSGSRCGATAAIYAGRST
ncbi:AAA domain protein [Rhodococcus sp. MTM3W5.2]|nr:AAA domain protein [Rhodococcus sp. MTM3W5.2]